MREMNARPGGRNPARTRFDASIPEPLSSVGVGAAPAPARHGTRSGRRPDGPNSPDWFGLIRFDLVKVGAGVARRGRGARGQHPVDLHAKVDQLAGKRVEAGL